jgi:transposase-like protein
MTEMSKRARRQFDTAFKLQVVRMIREQGMSLVQVCRVRISANVTAHFGHRDRRT